MVGEKVSESPFAPDQKKRLLKLLIVDDESYVCAGFATEHFLGIVGRIRDRAGGRRRTGSRDSSNARRPTSSLAMSGCPSWTAWRWPLGFVPSALAAK